MRPRDLSLRYKIPLRVSVLVLGTALAITVSLIVREYDHLKRDLLRNAESMGRVLADTLAAPLAHDDVWRSYEIIASPLRTSTSPGTSDGAEILMVLDAERRVYVSTRPDRFPMLVWPASVDPDYKAVVRAIEALSRLEPVAVDAAESDSFYMIVPIASDGVMLGALVMGYSKSMFTPRFYGLLWRAAVVTAAVLGVLLPISWYWGLRTGRPLIRLADAMGRIGPRVPAGLDFEPYDSQDEIGRLGTAFQRMVVELRKKESLENEVVQSERLAAIGQLAAGIAHEINNPLGGMLNAINTYQRHGSNDPMTLRTLSLLERGLVQIKDTVAALLVEAKVQSHALTRQDIEDVRTLVQPTALHKQARFVWENQVSEALPLPSTLVRQVLINLLLNAVEAVEHRGRVRCQARRENGQLEIHVANDGNFIREEQLPYLFEPFSRASRNGHGLGLWVTYQIVQQLGGQISVRSDQHETAFAVTLPLPQSAP
jgi:signal transduction histidine kinase